MCKEASCVDACGSIRIKEDPRMTQPYSLKIDAYSHIAPPRYKKIMDEMAPHEMDFKVDAITGSL